MKRSAGILPYKRVDGKLLVYLEHPGGPFWKGKDKWSICKGEYKKNEKAIDAAIREFNEESGFNVLLDDLFFIGSYKRDSSRKLITVFGIEKDFDSSLMKSNTFKKEWPPNSGKIQEFCEMDEGRWFDIEEARKKVFSGQEKILDKLKVIMDSEN